jgi:hypothetical protein
MEQRCGNHKIENAITQEFQALVIGCSGSYDASVRLEQCRIREYVAEFPGNRLRGHALRPSGRTLVVDQQADIPEQGDTLLVAKLDNDLAAILGHFQIARLEIEHVDFSKLVEGPANIGDRRFGPTLEIVALASFSILVYSI